MRVSQGSQRSSRSRQACSSAWRRRSPRRAEVNEALKEGGRSGDAAHGRAGRALVVSEIAISLVLLIAAGLLIRSFARLQDVPPGFDRQRLLTFRLSLPESRYTTFQKGDAFFDDLFARLRSNPDVRGVAAINVLPFSGSGGSRSFHIEGRAPLGPGEQMEEQLRFVTDDYFGVMSIPLVAGRRFDARDSLAGPRVAAINEAFARKHFPNGDPIGKRISFAEDPPLWYAVVGVVGNIKHRSLDAGDRPELYVPYRQPLFRVVDGAAHVCGRPHQQRAARRHAGRASRARTRGSRSADIGRA